jgi:hypothetical protein
VTISKTAFVLTGLMALGALAARGLRRVHHALAARLPVRGVVRLLSRAECSALFISGGSMMQLGCTGTETFTAIWGV